MLRYLLASTAALAITAPAAAETTISTAVTSPVKTSTATSTGTPDSITITSAGSVKPTSGTAVTIDSNHGVSNAGAIAVANSSGAIGIRADANLTGDIVNTGTITVDEPYTATDTDNDGDLDGPFALGNNRFGIRVDGVHTGKLTQSGTITVEGNDSAGIRLSGPLTGTFTHDGTTKVVGDRTVAVDAQAITGKVRLAGTVTAQGEGAIAARFAGDIAGLLEVQGTINSTGYRYTTAPANTASLDADDLLQGGPALIIEGNVTGGVIFAKPPADTSGTDNDEDKDGIEDSKEGTAAVVSYGAAPAALIGATDRAITLGSIEGTATGYGLIVQGGIQGAGVYTGVDGNGLVIGGRGGAVTVTNGIGLDGTVAATSLDARATAFRLGAGATTPLVQNAGTLTASSGSTAGSVAVAFQVDAGASLPVLKNAGSIKAAITGTNGSAGNAVAIVDYSGGLTAIENSGTISATGATADSGRNIAIDLSANTSGVNVRQTVVGSGIAAPSIVGDVRFGSGNDTFDIGDGTVSGAVNFGGGNNTLKLSGDAFQTGSVVFGAGADTVTLAGTSVLAGKVDFGGGADTLSLAGTSIFTAELVNSASLAVNVQGGILAIAKPVTVGSLTVGAGGTLRAVLSSDPTKASLYTITGTASFAEDATLSLTVADVKNAEGRYLVLTAGNLTGASGIETTTDLLPFLYKATLATDGPANSIVVDVARKTATELELNRSQAAAYNAIYAAIGNDDEVENVFLGITNGDLFRYSLRAMLPDHAGGTFESVSMGSRTLGRQIADPQSPVYSIGGLDLIFGTALWSGEKAEGNTAAYQYSGLGFSVAGEVDTRGLGAFGVMIDWFHNNHDDGSDISNVESDTYEIGAYWRGKWGGLNTFARAAIGKSSFSGRHTLSGSYLDGTTTKTVTKTAEGKWDGTLTSFGAGVSYEARSGSFFFRPGASLDYVKLDESGYTEDEGGDSLNLTVDKRKSDELAASGGLTVGFDVIGRSNPGFFNQGVDDRWFRLEGEGGWREIVGGALGSTTARFEDGTEFTLDPEENEGGWYARLRAVGGGTLFEMSGEAGAEQRRGETAFTLRGTLRLGL